MNLSWQAYFLEFRHQFTVSTFSRGHTPIVIVRLEQDNIIGFGEACLPPYLGESQESVIAFFKKVNLSQYKWPFNLSEVQEYIEQIDIENNSAKAAIDIALHDLYGKISSLRIIDYLGIKETGKLSSFTIGIDTIPKMIEKINEANQFGFEVLKIKIGTKDDFKLLNAILEHWKKPFSVDVNQGWDDRIYASELSFFLKEKNALFIEQPFKKDNYKDSAWLSQNSPLPIIADESLKRLPDLIRISDGFNGINIKIMKSAGITEAFKMIEAARKLNLKVVVGCMAESSCASSAAAILSSLADWADIDAPYLITNDPFEGMKVIGGKIILQKTKGIGINLNERLQS